MSFGMLFEIFSQTGFEAEGFDQPYFYKIIKSLVYFGLAEATAIDDITATW